MNYIEWIPGYNSIITNQNIPLEYHQDTLEYTLITVDQEYIDNQPDNYCVHASEHACLYANDDMFTCLYVDNCPVNKR